MLIDLDYVTGGVGVRAQTLAYSHSYAPRNSLYTTIMHLSAGNIQKEMHRCKQSSSAWYRFNSEHPYRSAIVRVVKNEGFLKPASTICEGWKEGR